jgi:hypothetical protein
MDSGVIYSIFRVLALEGYLDAVLLPFCLIVYGKYVRMAAEAV